jgi:hypothetical protein
MSILKKAKQKRHLYVLNKLKHKLLTGNAMLAQADKDSDIFIKIHFISYII